MGLPVEINPLLISSSGYVVGRSLRFRSSATAYLNRTPASASNRYTWTASIWLKRGLLSSTDVLELFAARSDDSNATRCFFDSSTGQLYFRNVIGGTATANFLTTQVFRDPSAWYHLVIVWDSSQTTSTNRVKVYINGVQISAFATATYPSQNESSWWNAVYAHNICNYPTYSRTFDGYLAEVNFIDGQALTPTSFGAYDTNGVWQPLKYGGTYGTNGFYLPFSDTTSTTTLCYDKSGNGNNWTPNNISLTAGTTYDSMIDSPTVSAISSNYCVLNPLDKNASSTLSNANLTSASGAAAWYGVRSSFAVTSGKWYWELTSVTQSSGNAIVVGIADASATLTYPGVTSNGYGYYSNTTSGIKYNNNSGTAYGAAFVQGDVIGVAFDADGGTITFYVNGVSQGQAFSGITSGPYFPMVGNYNTTSAINFGQRPFSYTPPSGYSALNTYNLPTPTIANGALYNAATLWTGNGTSQSIANSQSNGGNNPLGKSFYPDFVWYKGRTTTYNHALFDTIRGTLQRLSSNLTSAETTTAGSLTAFNSNGFSIGNDAGANQNTDTYVGWQWLAGAGSSSSNTSGSITSTVSVNATAGFSVVTFTAQTSGNATVGHGLGVAPDLIITKARANAYGWTSYHSALGNTKYIELNTTAAATTLSTVWNNTSPTSSVFTLGTSYVNNGTYVAYCFSAVRGYSAFGSYTGNGSTDGPFVYTGFRPRFLLAKRTDAAGYDWIMTDSSRSTYNVVGLRLFSNTADAESSATSPYDYLSNGFKLRNTNANENASGGTYIYMAFAENPFNYSRAR